MGRHLPFFMRRGTPSFMRNVMAAEPEDESPSFSFSKMVRPEIG